MTILFNEQNRIIRAFFYLLILIPFVAYPQLPAFPNSGNNTGIYCDVSTTWDGLAWSNGEPEAGKDVIIAADYTFSGGIFNACSITVLGTAHMIFTQEANAIIVHNVHVDLTAELVFESGSNLVQIEGQENTGNIIVKRNSSLIKKDDYTLWASPVSGQLLLDFSPLTMLNRFYTFDTTDNIYANVTAPVTTAFAPAKSYLIRTEENHPLIPTLWQGRFEGTPHTGNITFPLSYISENKSYNAVGNPYPSPINITEFINANSAVITGTIWLWRKTDDPDKSSYATVTKLGYQSNTIPDPDNATLLDPFTLHEDGVLNTAQGFLVKATGNQNLIFDNSMRLAVNSQSFFRPPPQRDPGEVIASRYWLNVTAENTFSQVLIGYTEEGTTGYDNGLDGEALLDGKTTLYSFASEKKLAIQARPGFEIGDIVPLGFKTETAGTFTFAIDHADGLFTEGQHIYILDTANNSVHDITGQGYTFTSVIDTFENRFKVIYDEDTAGIELPVASEKDIVVYSNNHQVKIQSTEEIASVAVYDLLGRVIFTQDNLSITDFSSAVLNTTAPVIARVTLNNGAVVSKKIVVQ